LLAEKKSAIQEAALQALSDNGQWLELTDALRELGELGTQPKVFYDKEEDAIHHRSTLANLQTQLTAKIDEEDPYAEQIVEMQEQGVEEISYDVMNELAVMRDHQDFLLKLLTNKDSFIRKRIIDQNLSY
jgi:hypothetical protein